MSLWFGLGFFIGGAFGGGMIFTFDRFGVFGSLVFLVVSCLVAFGYHAAWFRHLRVYGRFVVPVSRDRPVSIAGDVGDRQDGNVL
ncbi:MAG: hypothetical protein R3C19_07110 [Planctomycetaceae bacterium]